MKTMPIVPARIVAGDDGLPWSPVHGDRYHPAGGALAQAAHVFLRGNGLPQRWRGRDDFVVLEAGFGLGNNFLATWDAWRADPARCRRLHFLSIEKHPPRRDDLQRWHAGSPLPALSRALLDAWPPLTHNLHRLVFDDGGVQLSLAFGDVANWLRETVAAVDAFYLDGFAPARNPQMWQPRLFKAMARLAAPGATAATWSAARNVRDGLRAAGFTVQAAPGQGGKRDITLARHAPAFTPRRPSGHPPSPAGATRHAAIVGAGLAGSAAAWALAEQGWSSVLLERRGGLAQEASGNAVGLFHGVVHPEDGAHARFNRAAALQAAHAVARAMQAHGVRGSAAGLLRMEHARPQGMQQVIDALGLPADYVQALDAVAARARAGVPLCAPAWFYPGGGWVEPAGLARAFVERAAARVRFRPGVAVCALRRTPRGWELLGPDGRVVEQAEAVVLANAGEAAALLGHPAWPLSRLRGQATGVPVAALGAVPRLALAGDGYASPPLDDLVWCGATSDRDDDDPAVREADHLANLGRLRRLVGLAPQALPAGLAGRVAWRCSAIDRLPLIGPVPALSPAQAASAPLRLDQPGLVPRVEGLFVFTALASRGITWAALGGRSLAAAVTGAPMPLEASLRDAIDPARFVARAVRRAGITPAA